MAKKKEPEQDAVLKVEKRLYKRLATIAAHRGTSVKALADPILREFVTREWAKVVSEMQQEEE